MVICVGKKHAQPASPLEGEIEKGLPFNFKRSDPYLLSSKLAVCFVTVRSQSREKG